MAAFTVQNPPHAGLALSGGTPTAGAGANTAPCGNGLGLLIRNGSGSPVTLTMVVPAAITFDGLVIPSRPLVIAAGGASIMPLVAATYQDPATGLCTWGLSSITTVQADVIAIGA